MLGWDLKVPVAQGQDEVKRFVEATKWLNIASKSVGFQEVPANHRLQGSTQQNLPGNELGRSLPLIGQKPTKCQTLHHLVARVRQCRGSKDNELREVSGIS